MMADEEKKEISGETGGETKGEPGATSSEGNSAGPSETSASASPAKTVSDKVEILLKATGDAPIMEKRKWKLERTKTIGGVASFIKKYIKVDQNDSLFLYVNQAFAPALDVEVGTLFDCFGTEGKLVLHYCRTQAWG